MAKRISRAQFNVERQKFVDIQNHMRGLADIDHHGANSRFRRKLNQESERFFLDSGEESFVFEKELVLELLSQPGATHLRTYYGALPQIAGHPAWHGRPTIIICAAAGNSYFDLETYYVQWPDGLDANGDPLPLP